MDFVKIFFVLLIVFIMVVIIFIFDNFGYFNNIVDINLNYDEPVMYSHCNLNSQCGGDLVCDIKCQRCKQSLGGNCSTNNDCQQSLICSEWVCSYPKNYLSDNIKNNQSDNIKEDINIIDISNTETIIDPTKGNDLVKRDNNKKEVKWTKYNNVYYI